MVKGLDIPEIFKTSQGYVFDGIEAFCILCARFGSAGNMYDLTMEYDRSQSSISQCVNKLVEYLDSEWDLLAYNHTHLLAPSQLLKYADAIRHRGAPTRNVFAFIDCTIRRIACPSLYQRVAYNGYKRFHVLKFQTLMLLNGLFGHLYGAIEGRRSHNTLLADSGLMEHLAEFAIPEGVEDGVELKDQYYQIFGDPAYGIGQHMLSPFAGEGVQTEAEQNFNSQMSAVQIEVEHGFSIVANMWSFLNAG